jgi:FkbM family methyltransferase
MSAYSERMFAGLLGTQRLLMSVGVSRVVRKIPWAYFAYASLYQRWAPRHDVFVKSHGQKLFVSPEDMGMARAFLLSRGRWEELETRIFSSFLKEGMTIVDVGAHIGYYTLLAARLVGSKGHVFAFEPCPDNFRLLERNVKSNGHANVTLVPKAVSNRSGWATLQLDRLSSGGHSLCNFRGGARSIAVETVSLDEYFNGKSCSIDLVKTDAEGADPAVFQGMRRIVQRNPRLVYFTEFFPRAIHGMGFLPENYLRELAEVGLQVYFIDEDSGRIEPVEADGISRFIAPLMRRGATHDVLNLLCMRDFPARIDEAAAQAGDIR